MQPPPALPQLINSAPAAFAQRPSLTVPPPTPLAGGGQIQGSEAEDLTTLLPGLAYQFCRLWRSAGSDSDSVAPGKERTPHRETLGLSSPGRHHLWKAERNLHLTPSSLNPRNPKSLTMPQKEKLRPSQWQNYNR